MMFPRGGKKCLQEKPGVIKDNQVKGGIPVESLDSFKII